MRFHRTNRKTNGEQDPPRVTPSQWLLVSIPLVVATAGYEVTSYRTLALITQVLAVLNLALLLVVIREALAARVIGKLCMVGCVFMFSWVEALSLSVQRNPFSITEGFPIHASQFDQSLISQALFYLTVFQLLSFIGYSFRPGIARALVHISSRVDSLSFDRSIVGLVMGLCAVMPLVIYYDFDFDRIIGALLASRSATDLDAPEPGLSQHLALFGLYGAALFFVYAVKTNTWRRFWWLLLGVMAAIPFISGGTRHLWLFISLPSVLIVLRGFTGQLNSYRILGLLSAVFVLLLVAQAQFAYRNIGWKEVGNAAPEELTGINNTGQFTAQLFAQHLVPNDHPYFRELVEPYFVIHWIPRQFWTNKPTMESWEYYNDSYVQGAAYNVTPSIIGQFHLNWGLPGVIFIGAWLGFLSFLADRVLLSLNPDRQRAMFVVVGMFYAFIISSFRLYSPVYFSYFVFGVLAMLLLTRRRYSAQSLAQFGSRLPAVPALSNGSRAR
jgi:hypothetical protein